MYYIYSIDIPLQLSTPAQLTVTECTPVPSILASPHAVLAEHATVNVLALFPKIFAFLHALSLAHKTSHDSPDAQCKFPSSHILSRLQSNTHGSFGMQDPGLDNVLAELYMILCYVIYCVCVR